MKPLCNECEGSGFDMSGNGSGVVLLTSGEICGVLLTLVKGCAGEVGLLGPGKLGALSPGEVGLRLEEDVDPLTSPCIWMYSASGRSL